MGSIRPRGAFTPEVDLTAAEQDAGEQRNQVRLRQLKQAVESGYRPTQQEAQFIAGYYQYDPRANTVSDYSWWHTWSPIVMAAAGMAAGGVLSGTHALAGLLPNPGLVSGQIDTAAGGLPAAGGLLAAVVPGANPSPFHDHSTDLSDAGTTGNYPPPPPPEPYGPPAPTPPEPYGPPAPYHPPPPATHGASHLHDALIDTGLNAGGGLLQGLGESLFQQHRTSYDGTAADPVKLLSGITPKLDAMQSRITSRAPVDLGPGPGPLPTFSGGGLPMPIGIARRTDANSFQPPAGQDEHAQLLAALSILKGRG